MFKSIFILLVLSISALAQGQDLLLDRLLDAVKDNDIQTVRTQIQRGMSVDSSDPDGNTLLMLASREGRPEMVKVLLDLKASPKHRNSVGDSPLMFAALGGNLDVVRLLVDRGAEINQSGWTALHYCAWIGQTEVCKFLLDKGADIDAVSANGTTPLMMAVRGGHLATVKLLVWEVAELDTRNQDDATALQWALKGNHTEIANHLKQAGAKEQ